ncbi:MAG: hypothetical protein AAF292_11035 [Pseudomonadota bacterium]
MGRYKSQLNADRDAKLFPHAVDIPVPNRGLGNRMDVMDEWCADHVLDQWASHGVRVEYEHRSRYYFHDPHKAALFAETFDGIKVR